MREGVNVRWIDRVGSMRGLVSDDRLRSTRESIGYSEREPHPQLAFGLVCDDRLHRGVTPDQRMGRGSPWAL